MHVGELLDRGISSGPRLRKPLPWISSPLREPEHAHCPAGQVLTETTVPEPHLHREIEKRSPSQRSKLPPFKHRHESSTIELFYDLFFVANLTSFSRNHEIVDSKSKFRSLFLAIYLSHYSSTELYWFLHHLVVYLA